MNVLTTKELEAVGEICPDTLIHGDCLEAMQYIADGSVDLILCDLPYSVTQNRWDTLIPFAPLWEAYRRVIKPKGAIVLTAVQPFTSALVMSNPSMFKCEWVWDKRIPMGYLNAKIKPMSRHESVLVFGNGRVTYNPQMRTGVARVKGHAKSSQSSQCYGKHKPSQSFNDQYYPTSIVSISNANRIEKVHPTQKPTKLFEYLVKTYSNPGELVLDNTMGSGTLPMACINTGRHFIGIEKDDAYFAAACARIRERQMEVALAFDFGG